MKVVLFCGGKGMRLRDYSDTIPKPLAEVGPHPILLHLMKYYAHFGHKEFILCLGHAGHAIKSYFRNFDEFTANDFVMSQGGQKLELLRRGLDDESPAARGSALLSVQLLSKDSPGVVNAIRPVLHTIVSTDANQAVRRLAVVCLRNGSAQRETIVLLTGLAEDDEQEAELRNAARTVAADLKKRAAAKS